VPTYGSTAAFIRMLRRLTERRQERFYAARDLFVAELKAQGFTPPLHPSLRLHKLSGHDAWSISFGDGMRAVFRLGEPVKDNEVHVVWEFIGTHDEYERIY
jgi:hypothetical protein